MKNIPEKKVGKLKRGGNDAKRAKLAKFYFR
jgi:hypothetical protein